MLRIISCCLRNHLLVKDIFRPASEFTTRQFYPVFSSNRDDISFRRMCMQISTSNKLQNCWNCNKSLRFEDDEYLLCSGCGHIQDVSADIDYFKMLKTPRKFNIQRQELTQNFRKLQSIVHPDKFANKSPREKNNSSDWSSLVNKAYKTLLAPIDRGMYILKLYGLNIIEDNNKLEKDFLLNIMKRYEIIEEAETIISLQNLLDEVIKEIDEKFLEIDESLQNNDFDKTSVLLMEAKYLQSMHDNIRNKIEHLQNNH